MIATGATEQRARFRPSAALVRRLLACAGLLALASGMLLWRVHDTVGIYDEGVVLHGAEIVRHGGVPYRDMWTVYAPGQLYLVAAAFRLFGANVLSERLVDFGFRLLLALLLYGLLARLYGRRFALAAWVLLLVKLGYTGEYGYSVFPALISALLSGECVLRWVSTDRRRWLFMAGIAVAACSLFRQDFAAYIVLIDLALLALRVLVPPGTPFRPGGRLREFVTPSMLLLLAAGLAFAPVAAYFIATVGPATLRFDLFTFPLTTLRGMRALPLPPPDFGLLPLPGRAGADFGVTAQIGWLEFYGPALVYAAVAARLVRVWRSKGRLPTAAPVLWTELLVLALGIALFAQALSRYDEAHALPTVLCATVLAAGIFRRAAAKVRRPQRRILLYLSVSLITLLGLARPLTGAVHAAQFTPLGCHSAMPRAACAALDADQERALGVVQQLAPAGTAIFVGDIRHDAVALNDVSFYFLADRRAPTRYSVFDPGIVTTAAVQQTMLDDILRAGVQVVVLVDAPLGSQASRAGAGATVLDRALRDRFQPFVRFGAYTVFRAR